MQDRIYLLSLEESRGAEPEKESLLIQKALTKLDSERLKKTEHIRNNSKRVESIGAGILLQLALSEALKDSDESAVRDRITTQKEEIQRLSFEQLLKKVESLATPLQPQYTYGEHGKPYFKNFPFYFNISHSGKYVLCVLSEQEVGVDIQLRTRKVNERVIQQFFSTEEKAYWQQCDTEREQKDFFYRMWCRKEAYAKLTGEGIGDTIRKNMWTTESVEGGLYFEEYTLADDYQIAICKRKTI